MTDEDRDVREMLNRAAAGVEPSSDGLRKIEDKLAAAPRRRRRAPAMGVAAAVLVLALAGVLLVRDDDPDVRVATEPTTTVASTATSVPRTTTTMVDVVVQTYGIWPWPENDEFQSVAITGPVEVATGYVDAAVGITDATTISEYRAGDSMSGEVVFGGDIDTTVSVRDIGGAWNAVAASSELVSIEVGDDGTTSYSTAVAGELASSHSVPRGDAVTTGPTPVEAGTVGVDSASAGGAGDVARHRFTLRTDDGVTGLTEVRVERPVVAEPARVARDYVTSWVGMSSSTTMSELRATDATSGLIVFGGDLEATVRLRQVGGRWYVEASSTPLVEALEGSSPGEVRLIAREAGSLTVVMRSGDGRVVSSMPDRGVSAGEEVLVVPPSGTEPGTPLSVRYVLHTSRPAPESELSVSGIGEVHVVW